MSDAELNKAAVLIVKLLIRTREGKVQWSPFAPSAFGGKSFVAGLEDEMSAYLCRTKKEYFFALISPRIPPSEHMEGIDLDKFISESSIIQVGLPHSWDSDEDLTPESIVYSDLKQLFQLAESPKNLNEDRLYQQAMTYLDKIAV